MGAGRMRSGSFRGGRSGSRGFQTKLQNMQRANALEAQRAQARLNAIAPRGSRVARGEPLAATGFGLGTPVDPYDDSQFGLGRRIPADAGGSFGLGRRIPRDAAPRQGLSFAPVPAPPAEEKKAASSPAKETTSISTPLAPAPAPEDYGRYDSNPFVSDLRYGNFGIVVEEGTPESSKRFFGDRYNLYAPKGDQLWGSFGTIQQAEDQLRKAKKDYENEGSDAYGRSILDMYDIKSGKTWLGEGDPVTSTYDSKTKKFIDNLRKKPKEESRSSTGSFLGDPGAVKDRGNNIDSVFVDVPKTPAEEAFGGEPDYRMPEDAKDGFAYMLGGVRDGGAFDAAKFKQEMKTKRGRLENQMRQRREQARARFAERRGSRGRAPGFGLSGGAPGFGVDNRGTDVNSLRFGGGNDGGMRRRLAGGGVRGTRGVSPSRAVTGRVRGAR